jgi:hypothetical protein
MRRFVLAGVLVATMAVVAAGCGGMYHTVAMVGANSAFEEARLAGAEKWAPYEFYRAQEYLAKSREEAGYSDFESAIHFAKVSKEAAKKALEKASMHKGSSVAPDPVDAP